MIIAVSPYHLTTREPPAMASLLLADQVVTILPSPTAAPSNHTYGSHAHNAAASSASASSASTSSAASSPSARPGNHVRARAEELAGRLPRFRALMRSWEWLVPLWKRGIVTSGLGGLDAVDDAREACRTLSRGAAGRYASLSALMRPELFDDDEHYLDAFAHDLNRAGPDPGVTVPVHTGLDWFAVRAAERLDGDTPSLLVARSEPVSIAQQAETKLAKPILVFAMPILLRAGPRALIRARDLLAQPLDELRAALAVAIDGRESAEAGGPAPDSIPALTAATRSYAAAFNAARPHLDDDDDDDVETMEGTVKVSIVSLPADAVLESSLAAVKRMMPVGAGPDASIEGDQRPLPDHPLPFAGRRFLAMILKVMGKSR